MALDIIQSVSGILLMLGILLQNRGSGLGAAFGDTSSLQHTKRGAEKFLHYFTIMFTVIFLGVSFLNILY